MGYTRVNPRDLFNEAKLLKCIGKVALLIHEGGIQGLTMEHEDPENGYNIHQNTLDGSIEVQNLLFADKNGETVAFRTPLNSKYQWPLLMEYRGEEYYAFSEKGDWMPDKNLFSE